MNLPPSFTPLHCSRPPAFEFISRGRGRSSQFDNRVVGISRDIFFSSISQSLRDFLTLAVEEGDAGEQLLLVRFGETFSDLFFASEITFFFGVGGGSG